MNFPVWAQTTYRVVSRSCCSEGCLCKAASCKHAGISIPSLRLWFRLSPGSTWHFQTQGEEPPPSRLPSPPAHLASQVCLSNQVQTAPGRRGLLQSSPDPLCKRQLPHTKQQFLSQNTCLQTGSGVGGCQLKAGSQGEIWKFILPPLPQFH